MREGVEERERRVRVECCVDKVIRSKNKNKEIKQHLSWHRAGMRCRRKRGSALGTRSWTRARLHFDQGQCCKKSLLLEEPGSSTEEARTEPETQYVLVRLVVQAQPEVRE